MAQSSNWLSNNFPIWIKFHKKRVDGVFFDGDSVIFLQCASPKNLDFPPRKKSVQPQQYVASDVKICTFHDKPINIYRVISHLKIEAIPQDKFLSSLQRLYLDEASSLPSDCNTGVWSWDVWHWVYDYVRGWLIIWQEIILSKILHTTKVNAIGQ